ncbi:pyridoxamine 5'-phosphate oxidase family protein [Jannaschia pohangensis]|uniref:Pyridoxamine 5'-phosphate oxidase n=1 Tax=Jannaschia pohangensis TaxID=390807 RepID=A0A1I3JVQ3_9RHOB|nr:pyridoxamine 5'-phosphate oxidase family protein [Jannaschia pohangensis]SFI64236.1 Pyridoxamine 5'-phosphate oxidase [Jannaschia pohangensis]
MNDPFLTLSDLEDHVWDRLAQGAANADDPFRFVTLATMGQDGPEARTVGLRRADRAASEVEVHSDLRTAKVRALAVDPRATILLWDAATQVQVRLRVTLRLVASDPIRWARVPPLARLNYGTDPAPGTPVDMPEVVTRTPDVARFCALVGRVHAMDALSLAHDPHRRARFADGQRHWIAP